MTTTHPETEAPLPSGRLSLQRNPGNELTAAPRAMRRAAIQAHSHRCEDSAPLASSPSSKPGSESSREPCGLCPILSCEPLKGPHHWPGGHWPDAVHCSRTKPDGREPGRPASHCGRESCLVHAEPAQLQRDEIRLQVQALSPGGPAWGWWQPRQCGDNSASLHKALFSIQEPWRGGT